MPRELMQVAVEAARAGGEVVERLFRAADLEVREKAENDLVSLADRQSEARIVETIRRSFPDHRIVAEEGGGTGSAAGELEWLVDPLDGTSNFIQGLPIWCVSVACRRGPKVAAGAIFHPHDRDLFQAARSEGAWWNGESMRVSARSGLPGAFLATGYPFKAKAAVDDYLEIFRRVFLEARSIRRCGSAGLDLAYTAAGIYDGFFEFRLAPWDLAAGALMIEEAGGEVTDLDGGAGFLRTGNAVAGTPGVHAELLAAVRAQGGEARLDELVPLSADPSC